MWEKAAEELHEFAMDRALVKTVSEQVHESAKVDRNTLEYELQVLRIITVGWAISYLWAEHAGKTALSEQYWQSVAQTAGELSEATGLLIGQEIDYFQVVKDRLDQYVTAVAEQPDAAEPAAVIGPEFARICSDEGDVFAVMAGARMFKHTLGGVGDYLSCQVP